MSVQDPNLVDVAQLPGNDRLNKINVLLVTSVALSFISFWRAAAIVLCDLASTAYYIGGISEQAIGKAAPWFILGVMLFSYAVRSVYVESCTMFTRGGVYKVVKGAVGGNLAKLSVSALMFDYVLTGPISAVAAGQYILGLFGEIMLRLTEHSAHPILFPSHRNCVVVGGDLSADHPLFLACQHQGHPRIQRQSASHHAADDGYGRADHRLERADFVHAPRACFGAAIPSGLHW
jgi:hypothetical protein